MWDEFRGGAAWATSATVIGTSAGCSPPREEIHVRVAPLLQRRDDRRQGSAAIGQAVLDAWRHLGEDLALDQAVDLQFAELIGQHAWCHVTSPAAQFVEARRPVLKMVEDHRLPLAVDQAYRRFDGAAWVTVEAGVTGFRHRDSILFDTMSVFC